MSTPQEKIEAQSMALEFRPVQPWHHHMIGAVELERLFAIKQKYEPIELRLPHLEPITTKLASTEDAENDRLYDKWNKKERHD